LNDPPAGLPTWFTWDYDLAELVADAVVHASGMLAALIGAVMLAAVVLPSGVLGDSAAVLVYVIGLVTTLGLSATYNLWPVSPMKWILRRFDHSTIYLFIAATYTPFLPRITSSFWTVAWLVYIWGFAIAGATLKLFWPGRLERVAVAFYVLLGWSGILLLGRLPWTTLQFLVLGGLLYSTGIAFHLWDRLRFQNAIWHFFVLLAAGSHYFAVLTCIAEI
jgi:hemolysin III